MVNSTPGGGHISHHTEGSLGKFTKNIIDTPLTKDGYHMDLENTAYLIEKAMQKKGTRSWRTLVISRQVIGKITS